MKIARHFTLVVIAALLVMVCQGCKQGDFATTAYRSMVAAGSVYDVTMRALADARSEGIITTEQYARGKDCGRVFYALYHTARIGLEEYVAHGNASSAQRERILATLSAMALRLTELTEYVRQIGVVVTSQEESHG